MLNPGHLRRQISYIFFVLLTYPFRALGTDGANVDAENQDVALQACIEEAGSLETGTAGQHKSCGYVFDERSEFFDLDILQALKRPGNSFIIIPGVLNSSAVSNSSSDLFLVTRSDNLSSASGRNYFTQVLQELINEHSRKQPDTVVNIPQQFRFWIGNENVELTAWNINLLMEGILAPKMLTLLNQSAVDDGPNCWGTALYLSGLSRGLAYRDTFDFQQVIEGPALSEISYKNVRFGDILALRYYDKATRLIESHAAVFVTPSIVFSKPSPDIEDLFQLEDVRSYRNRFKLNDKTLDRCLFPRASGFRGSQACPAFGNIFRPVSNTALIDWMTANSPNYKDTGWSLLESLLQLEKDVLSVNEQIGEEDIDRPKLEKLQTFAIENKRFIIEHQSKQNLHLLPTKVMSDQRKNAYATTMLLQRLYSYKTTLQTYSLARDWDFMIAPPGFQLFFPLSDPEWSFDKPSLDKQALSNLGLQPAVDF